MVLLRHQIRQVDTSYVFVYGLVVSGVEERFRTSPVRMRGARILSIRRLYTIDRAAALVFVDFRTLCSVPVLVYARPSLSVDDSTGPHGGSITHSAN